MVESGIERFLEEKQAVKTVLDAGGNFSDGSLDEGMRELVYHLNDLPFAYMTGSYGVKLHVNGDIVTIPSRPGTEPRTYVLSINPELCVFRNAQLGLIVLNDAGGRGFEKDLRVLLAEYDRTAVFDANGRSTPKNGRELYVYLEASGEGPENALPTKEGLQRVENVKAITKEILALADRYLIKTS